MFPFIGVLIENVATFIPKVIEIVGVNLLQFARIISDIFKELGFLPPEENIIDLGNKAIQAEEQGIRPENYDSYNEYLTAVQAFEIDDERTDFIDENKKIEKGVEIITATLVEDYGEIIMDLFMLIAKHPYYFENRMSYFLEIQKTDPHILSDITRYIEKKENDIDIADKTLGKIYEVEKKINDNVSLQDMMNEIEKLKD